MKDGYKHHSHLRFCISAGYHDDWAMYVGPGHWTRERVRDYGDKIPEDLAVLLVRLLDLRSERPGDGPFSILERKYRP